MDGEGKSFSFSKIKNFDEHIAREIRGYPILDDIIAGLVEMLAVDKTRIFDIGCSSGRLLNKLATNFENEEDRARQKKIQLVGIEPNDNFTKEHDALNSAVEIQQDRVTAQTTFSEASIVFSIFTLQFVPVHERGAILQNIYKGLLPEGAFIWAEKVYSEDSEIEALITKNHIDFKHEKSSADSILEKDKRLRAIMRPLKMSQNINLLENAGFTRYETFWRVNNFVALLAIK